MSYRYHLTPKLPPVPMTVIPASIEPIGATPYWEVNDSSPKGDSAGVSNIWMVLLMLLGMLSIGYIFISQEERRGN